MKRKSVASNSAHKPCNEITRHTFSTFLLCKAFDVIGNGSYKQYIIKCKENNDQWAIDAHKCINTVLDYLKRILTLLHKMQSLPNVTLSNICKETVGNTTPPTTTGTEWGVCCISGEHSKDCVRLHRGSGRSNDTIHIHTKYFRFIKMLWFTTKIEHVIRSMTRHWLEQNAETLNNMSIAEKCTYFERNFKHIDQYFSFFSYAICHIEESFQVLLYPGSTCMCSRNNNLSCACRLTYTTTYSTCH